ncbi:MAG: alpha/beta hydrolase [Bacteroidales bacterium]|nr:alpha/beta hydrolase [Bacteroidales bacterium]
MMTKKAFILIVFLFFALLQAYSQEVHDDEQSLKAPRGYWNETFLKAAYAIRRIDLIETEPAVPENIEIDKAIVYKQVDSASLKLDIYKLKNLNKAAPVLIFIHGGAWAKGERSDYLPYLLDYAKKGYVTATISYRLSQEAPFPAAVMDVKCAVRWIRAHADQYMINPEKIAVIGGSAGGHLAMMLAYSDEKEFGEDCTDGPGGKVQVVVNLYGPADLSTEYAQEQSSVLEFLGESYQENPGLYLTASPGAYISSDDPPTLIFHGTIDSTVPVSQSDSLHKWLDQAGVPNEYHKLKGWPHTMDVSKRVNEYCQHYMDAFFKQYL